MFKTYETFCDFITNIFDQIEQNIKIDAIEVTGYSRRDIDEFIYQCVTSEYIVNIDVYRDANGNPHFDTIGTPYISIAGYAFLNKLRSDVALQKAKNADIRGWISVVIAFLALVWNIVSSLFT